MSNLEACKRPEDPTSPTVEVGEYLSRLADVEGDEFMRQYVSEMWARDDMEDE